MYEESQDYKVIYVNTKKVGYLIGHHGRTIWHFQDQSGANIAVMTPNSRAKETPVKISGKTENVRRALRMILDLFSFDNNSTQFWEIIKELSQGKSGPGNERAIIGHEETKVPSYFAEFLRVSETVQKIEEVCGSKIIVLPESDVSSSVSIINVIGTAEGNTKAFEILNERYREVEEANQQVSNNNIVNEEVETDTTNESEEITPIKKPRVEQPNLFESSSQIQLNGYQRPCIKVMDGSKKIGTRERKVGKVCTAISNLHQDTLKVPSIVIDYINLQPICRKNQVTVEIKSACSTPSTSSNESNLKIVVISGKKINVRDAKDDLAVEVAEWLDHLSK